MKRVFASILICLCAALIVVPALAQDDQATQANQPRRETPPAPLPEPKPINLEFPGGTATEYINAVRKAATDVNIVTMADLSSIQVPPVSLKNVNPASAIEILQSIPQEQPGRHIEIHFREDRPKSREQLPVFTVTANIIANSVQGRRAGEQTTVASISDLLEGKLKAADLLTAVQTALEMLKNEAQPAQIRFHEETGLLIARGSDDQISAITMVLQQVRERAGRDRVRDDARDQLQKAMNRAAQLELELGKTTALLETSTRDHAASKNFNADLNNELEKARTELKTAYKQIDDCHVLVLQLQSEAAKPKVRTQEPPKPQ